MGGAGGARGGGAGDGTSAGVESRETMPASPWEVGEAISEGVKVVPNTAVSRFRMQDGRVTGFEAVRVERVDFDAMGRVVPRTVPGAGFEVPAETVVTAIGSRADLGFLPPGTARFPVDVSRHVFRLIFREREPKIPAYACGDCVRGPGTVVEASASGRAAALNIYSRLCVEEVRKARYRDNYRRRSEPQVPDRAEWRVRLRPERLPPAESRGNFEEVVKGFTAECAVREAERCARCNLWL